MKSRKVEEREKRNKIFYRFLVFFSYTFLLFFSSTFLLLMSPDNSIHHKRGWTGTIITLAVLFLLGAFVWKVVYFAQEIRSGGMNFADLNYSQTVSSMTKLASQPVTDKVVDVVVKDRPTLGKLGTPVTIVEFGDFSCPFSRASSFVVRALAAQYPNQVAFIYRDFPLSEIHPFAEKAAEAAACAQAQNKFWEFHDKLYQNQNTIDDTSFEQFASQLNLDTAKFHGCLVNHTYAKQVADDYQAGFDAGVRGTPTFFINGNRIPGSIPQNVLEQVILSLNTQKK